MKETGTEMYKPKVLTWHVHGSYLSYLSHAELDIRIPVRPGNPEGYGKLGSNFRWGEGVREIDARQVRMQEFDLILYQSEKNYLVDQYDILSSTQRRLPRLYLEHNPPREHPTDTRHIADDPDIDIVHVTHFNELMWDTDNTTYVIEHGVPSDNTTTGTLEFEKGISVVNNIRSRGRRVGKDILKRVRKEIPVDLVGMDSYSSGGLGEVPHTTLTQVLSKYRFFFYPVRYTSLGLAVCEAMMSGIPVIALATTEMPSIIINGYNGWTDTDIGVLIRKMQLLLKDRTLAKTWGDNARKTARDRFSMKRFIRDWNDIVSKTLLKHKTKELRKYTGLQPLFDGGISL